MSARFAFSPSFAALVVISLTAAFGAPPVIDDQELLETIRTTMEKQIEAGGKPTADQLAENARKSRRKSPTISLPAPQGTPPSPDYETLSRSVYLVGTIYKCGKCDKWHQGSSATAWCLGEDGLMVTNAHVFRGAKGGIMGVADRDGRCHPVTELLGIDATTDVAIFRVEAKGLQPLRLGIAANVGDPVTVISHPAGHHFLKTAGSVSRYSKRKQSKNDEKTTWMAITADYAKGSSGGPVFNAAGEVVGMVSSTSSIYTDPGPSKEDPKGQLQMVIKNCVPADSIRALFEKPATTEKQAGT